MANALTVDVEDYFHASALAPGVQGKSWRSLESRVAGNTRKLLAIFEEFRVRGTFFVLGWVAEHYPTLVCDIAKGGHEIACHGYSHRLVYEQSPKEFREETLYAKPAQGHNRVRGTRISRGQLFRRARVTAICLVSDHLSETPLESGEGHREHEAKSDVCTSHSKAVAI